MKLNFRIDWGYQYLYSRRHYHPCYLWDGHLECTAGRVTALYRLDYPVLWFGPGHSARETRLEGTTWQSATRRGFAGVRVEAEADAGCAFRLVTLSGTFEFTAVELLRKKRLVFPVGPKYLGCHVIVTLTGHYWFLPPARDGETVWAADDFAGTVPVRDWARMRTAWVAPGASLAFTAELPESPAEFRESILHVVCMAAPEYTPGAERQCHDDFPMRLLCDGQEVARATRYLRAHDTFMQLLEDVWLRFQANPGRHEFRLCNDHPKFFLLVTRMTLRHCEHRHLDLSLPAWALAGEPLTGRVFATHEDEVTFDWSEGARRQTLQPGWNDFAFSLRIPGRNRPVTAGDSRGVVGAVYDLADEAPEVMVGYDMTTVPHDDSGLMDWLLDYTWRTRLGNLVVFRNFRCKSPDSAAIGAVPDELLTRWGDFCRRHRIHVEAATDFDSGALVRASGEMLHSVGRHEWPGAVYAFDPSMEWRSEDMKSAMEHYLKYLRIEIERAHRVAPRAAFGDASGGHRYCYLAGADFLRTETMVPHTQHICSQARPAAEALGTGEWGVHIAIQHACQPYFENHLGIYYLSLLQPWMMGAKMIYEEDSLFELFKEERQAWDDRLTKGKRDMTRDFFKFAKTHPRKGSPTCRIAFVEGRYAAPFNGFICDSDQSPDYSVWGLFGKNDPLWGHRQPEKCRQLLDVLMPGASTHPLRQDFTRRRFFFSGTPYGDFDEVPAEATADYLGRYALLLHLGWNTMLQEDYDKLMAFVENGGTLLVGLPEFSRHVRREFLEDMMDLDLWNDGDLAELCGVRVLGPGPVFRGTWNCAGRERLAALAPKLSGIPSHFPEEDGPCRLAKLQLVGAEAVIWDAATGLPLVTRFRKGQGEVYLVTAYAYPGHETLREVVSTLMVQLCSRSLPANFVVDPSGEVFWNEWRESDSVQRLMLLNTDWTEPGNRKSVQIHCGEIAFSTEVVEREAKLLTVLSGMVLEPMDALLHLEINAEGAQITVRAHGEGVHAIRVHTSSGCREIQLDFADNTVMELTL